MATGSVKAVGVIEAKLDSLQGDSKFVVNCASSDLLTVVVSSWYFENDLAVTLTIYVCASLTGARSLS